MPELLGETIYNFWKDDVHERGIWRRTTLASYRTASPQWETVLDVDALAKADGKSWVFKEANCLPPSNTRCLVSLSQGGSDAIVVREFDTKTKQFVAGGFSLPEAKSSVAWRDEDTLWVGTDFGPDSMTTSGYPRIVKLWKRGTPLSAAKTIFEGKTEDVGAFGTSEILSDGRYDIVTRIPDDLHPGHPSPPRRSPRQAGCAAGPRPPRLLPRALPLLAPQRLAGGGQDVSGRVAPGGAGRRSRRRQGSEARNALRADGAHLARERQAHEGSRADRGTLDNVKSRLAALSLKERLLGIDPRFRRQASAPRT